MSSIEDLLVGLDDGEAARGDAVSALQADARTLIDTLGDALAMARSAAQRGCAAVAASLDADATALRAVVTGFRADADACAAAAEAVAGVSAVALPAGLVGVTGTAVGETITAVVTSLTQEAEGQDLVAQHLSAYADALDELEQARTAAVSRAESGRAAVEAVEAPDFGSFHGIFGWDSPLYDDFDQAREVAAEALGALGEVHAATLDYRTALTGLRELVGPTEVGLGDANGYARVGGVLAGGGVLPEGFTPLDLMTSHYSSSPDQPDAAILSDTEWENFTTRWNSLTDEEHAQLLAAMSGTADGRTPALVMSALATGAPLAAVLALAARLKELSATPEGREVISEIAGLRLAGAAGRADPDVPGSANVLLVDGEQFDQEGPTCASTDLLLLAAQTDPFLALVVATGEPVDGYWPEVLELLEPADLEGLTPAERFRLLQVEARNFINQGEEGMEWHLGDDPADEPGSLRSGTADVTGTTLTDPSPESLAQMTQVVDSGRPVPVSVTVVDPDDPDGGGGHQLLVVGHENGTYQVYEPNTGVWEVSAEDLASGVLPPEAVEGIFGDDRFFAHNGYYLP